MENVKREVMPELAREAPANQQLAITPMAMLQIAVQRGADLAQLEKLMELQERWEKNEARKAFFVALNAFKADPPTLSKNKHVKFGTTEYDHATLDQVSLVIGKALSGHKLSHRWDVEQKEGNITVACVLTHEKGHSERVPMSATADTSGSKNSIQAIGSTVTYLQRYTLLAATGMAVKGQDDDGRGATKRMPEAARLDFKSAIDALADVTSAESLWKQIAKACKDSGDTDAYKALKEQITEKGKQLKAKR